MSSKELITTRIAAHISLMASLLDDAVYLEAVAAAATAMTIALRNGNKVLFFGNGGSAADAQHLAAELTGRFLHERHSLAAFALATNPSEVTAIGNDYGYEEVFARPLAGLGAPSDVAFGISTSGNSPNVLRAFEVAHRKRMVTIGLSGQAGKLASVAQHAICIPSDCTPRIQEAHILTGHILCEIIERELMKTLHGEEFSNSDLSTTLNVLDQPTGHPSTIYRQINSSNVVGHGIAQEDYCVSDVFGLPPAIQQGMTSPGYVESRIVE
jgi:D-sedoheptulose 7-phosphate isomerase